MSEPIFLKPGPSQPVSIKIAHPAKDALIHNNAFVVYGYVSPADVDKLEAWLWSYRSPYQKIRGTPLPLLPPPFDWAFAFTDVPPKVFFKLIAEAEDVHGTTVRDVRRIVCLLPGFLTVEIGTPANNDEVFRTFSALGWVSNTSATMTAWVEKPQGTKIVDGVQVAPPGTPTYDWQFDFVLPKTAKGQAWVTVQADDGGGNPVTDTRTITVL